MISQRPTYEELEQRIKELEKESGRIKEVEEELWKYRFMVESAHDAIFFKDLESRYIIANDKALEAFGLSREDVIGKNDYELMPDQEEAKKNVSDDQIIFDSGKPTEIYKHMTRADGIEHWFQAIKAP
jgi:PAS domain S-box-containing protein